MRDVLPYCVRIADAARYWGGHIAMVMPLSWSLLRVMIDV